METSDFDFEVLTKSGLSSWSEGVALIDKLFDVTRPGAVFGPPASAGDYTVMTASEVWVGMGMGYGFGSGFGPQAEEEEVSPAGDAGGEGEASTDDAADEDVPGEELEAEAWQAGGAGGGGGGGGFSAGRPVAVISIGPDGVAVQPVVDATKVVIAFFTMLGTLLVMIGKMRQARDA